MFVAVKVISIISSFVKNPILLFLLLDPLPINSPLFINVEFLQFDSLLAHNPHIIGVKVSRLEPTPIYNLHLRGLILMSMPHMTHTLTAGASVAMSTCPPNLMLSIVYKDSPQTIMHLP